MGQCTGEGPEGRQDSGRRKGKKVWGFNEFRQGAKDKDETSF